MHHHYNKLSEEFSNLFLNLMSIVLGALENLFSLAVLGLNSISWLFMLCLVGRKRKKERERKTIPLFGREIEGEKKNWGNYFPFGPPFFYPPKMEGNKKDERVVHGPHHFFFHFPFVFMNKKRDQCYPHTPGPCMKMGTMHGTTQGRMTYVFFFFGWKEIY